MERDRHSLVQPGSSSHDLMYGVQVNTIETALAGPHDLGRGVTLAPMLFAIRSVDVVDADNRIDVHVVVAERDEAKPIRLAFRVGVENAPTDPGQRREMVKRVLLEVLEHELDELLLVDGKRVADPHRVTSVSISMGIPA